MSYFSEKEEGERPRTSEEIGEAAWGGIKAQIATRIENGAFGASYPASCEDGRGAIGTDAEMLWQGMRAEVPNLQEREWPPWYHQETMPRTLDVLDMIEFCWRCVGQPERGSYHSFFDHYHLTFDIELGQDEFREDINRIFRRNGLAYVLTEDGEVERLAPLVLRENLASIKFQSRDDDLNQMLDSACSKFLDPDEDVRLEALEKLWDAWERLKSLGPGRDKKARITALLDCTAGPSSPELRQSLEHEARELTRIGNSMRIRHSERDQERVSGGEPIDYLFHRLFSLIYLILRSNPDL